MRFSACRHDDALQDNADSTAILNNRSLQCKEYGQNSFNEEFCNYKTISCT